MKVKLNKNSVLSFLEYLIAICLIFDINSVWLRKDNLGDNFFTYFAVTLLIMYVVIASKGLISRRRIGILFAFTLYVVLMVLTKLSITYLIRGIFEIGIAFPLMLYALKYNMESERKSWVEKVSDVVVIIAAISLLFYFTGSVLDIMPGETTVTFSWGGDQTVPAYYNIYFESAQPVYVLRTIIGEKIVRNCACFLEPPMYAFVLCLSLGYEILGKSKISIKRALILIVTIITTGSSTGIGTATLALAMYFMLKTVANKKKNILRVIGLVIVPLVVGIAIYTISFLLADKINNMVGSYNIRGDDVSACIRTFLSSPLWGVGIYNNNPIYARFSSFISRPSNGLSTGLLIMLAQTGITMIIWPIIVVVRKRYEMWQYCLLIIFLVLFTMTNVPYKLLNILYVGSILMVPKNKPGVKKKNDC